MKNSKISIAGLCVLVCSMFFMSIVLRAEEPRGTITISKEGAGRITIALDRISAKGGHDSELARSVDGTINRGLDFTGLFNLLQAPLNLRSAQGGALNIQALSSVGAEIYSGGTLTARPGSVTLEMEVYDAVGGKQLMKRSYAGSESQLRQMGQQFCSDLIELLTGKKCLIFGSKIVFVANTSGSKEVYLCDFDGSNVVQLTSSRSISLNPAISPDGKYLALTDFTAGHPDLYICNLSNKSKVAVTHQGIGITPAWRPGAAEIAATLSFEGDQDIYLIRPDGRISRRVTNSKGIDVSPTFSPDGSQIAFVSSRSGKPQIFIQNLQGGDARRLTFSGNYNTQPCWSPLGDKIAFSSLQKNGEINIFSINADGSGLMQLTSGTRLNEYPSWAPDGSMIVFSSSRSGRRKLFVMNADGTNQRSLLNSDGEQQQPSWSRIR